VAEAKVGLVRVRTFIWWFGMGAFTTLAVLMVQGGVRDLLYETHPSGSASAYLSFATTILGGGLLAGCLALIMVRLK
jgi:hypothetical protein